MNLQTMQKRIEELSAELLTLSNDMAFLISGDVTRAGVVQPEPIMHHGALKVGDRIRFSAPFEDTCGDKHHAGVYTVADVERPDYTGDYDVAVHLGEGLCWIDFKRTTRRANSVTKEA